MTFTRILAVAIAAAFALPAFAAPVAAPAPSGDRVVLIQKAEEHGKKKAKGKEEKKNADRSNKGGETRAGERSDQVQGMQDTGKGAGKRKQ